MKVEIVRAEKDWIVLDGAGKVIATAYERCPTGIPRAVSEALEKALLLPGERDPRGEDDE